LQLPAISDSVGIYRVKLIFSYNFTLSEQSEKSKTDTECDNFDFLHLRISTCVSGRIDVEFIIPDIAMQKIEF
jgi:hypothetical protein